jgi:hypothetical protein
MLSRVCEILPNEAGMSGAGLEESILNDHHRHTIGGC